MNIGSIHIKPVEEFLKLFDWFGSTTIPIYIFNEFLLLNKISQAYCFVYGMSYLYSIRKKLKEDQIVEDLGFSSTFSELDNLAFSLIIAVILAKDAS